MRTWLERHREQQPYNGDWDPASVRSSWHSGLMYSRDPRGIEGSRPSALLSDRNFSSHSNNDGSHVSPYDEGRVDIGVDGLKVELIQGIDEASFKRVLSRALRATTGIHPDEPETEEDAHEMMRGGLQAALESQTLVFQVTGASRALTHQIVRTRKAAYHQQSQRATWYGDRPNQRWPESVFRAGSNVSDLWKQALVASWAAYKAACDAGVSYQDARYILPEGTTNYILCEYTVREFIAVFAYRGCSMFLWEMVQYAREARRIVIEAHPFLEPYIKISCEKPIKPCETCEGHGYYPTVNGKDQPCPDCYGVGDIHKCTFQGWESVEGQCDLPWAKQDNRTFLPAPRYRIGA